MGQGDCKKNDRRRTRRSLILQVYPILRWFKKKNVFSLSLSPSLTPSLSLPHPLSSLSLSLCLSPSLTPSLSLPHPLSSLSLSLLHSLPLSHFLTLSLLSVCKIKFQVRSLLVSSPPQLSFFLSDFLSHRVSVWFTCLLPNRTLIIFSWFCLSFYYFYLFVYFHFSFSVLSLATKCGHSLIVFSIQLFNDLGFNKYIWCTRVRNTQTSEHRGARVQTKIHSRSVSH